MDYSQFKQLEFRRKFLKVIGAEIIVTNPANDQIVGFIKMKGWKLREDIRVYTDNTMNQEVIRIGARQIIDLSAKYDVFDSVSNQHIFTLKRRGWKSVFVRDHWDILDVNGNPFGELQETSNSLAIARRWLEMLSDLLGLIFAFVPQKYELNMQANGSSALAARFIHRKNPVIVKLGLDTSDAQVQADPRILLAMGAMLSIIEASKNA